MSIHRPLSRRGFHRLAGNLALAGLAAGAFGTMRFARAADAVANLGHFGSANPQTFSKATQAFDKALGAGVKVNYVGISAGPQIISAMAGGSMDICNIGSSPMVTGFASGLKISMIYVQKIITDSECLAVRKELGINDVAGLKGRSIGLPFNTSVHFALLGALKQAGLKPTDVKLVNLRPDSIVAAWKRKDIDATYMWYPVLGDTVGDGGTIIFKTCDLQDSGVLVFDGIIVRNEFKERHPELVLAYLKEYDRICGLYREQPQQVIDVLSPYLSLSPAATLDYVKTFHTLTPQQMIGKTWMGTPGMKDTGVLNTIRAQAEFLKEADQVKAVPADFSPFVDSSFLAKMV